MSCKIEIAKCKQNVPSDQIEDVIRDLLKKKKMRENTLVLIPSAEHPDLNKFQEQFLSITLNNIPENLDESRIKFYYYEFSDQGPETESIECHESEQVAASVHWMLPSKEYFGLWESLVYDDNLKEKLLNFSETMLLFSNKNVDQNIVSCNRLIVLHGVPGTGKTSLAKALAQKLSIQMNESYQFTHLFEINSHSLFSKWFSESGKLVMKMFEQIQEVIEIESSLVCVLIDEVESIAFARGNVSTNEPSDSVRVVNAVLTQLDRIKKYPNVLIITTSNLTASIDLAFLDRADIVMKIGEPSPEAVYKIILSSITELVTKSIIIDDTNVDTIRSIVNLSDLEALALPLASTIQEVCRKANGLSGRALRKLPFIAHALFIYKSPSTIQDFLSAMHLAIDYQNNSKQSIGQFNEKEKSN